MSQNIIQEFQHGSSKIYRPQNHCIVDDIRYIFEINENTQLLGQGVSGKVYKTCLRQNVASPNGNVEANKFYALKCMNKSVAWIEKSFLRESHNMLALSKIPGTINCIGTFEDREYFCILSELAGSDAFSMVKKSRFGRLDEHYVKYCIYEMLKTLFYLHSMNYVHRDIKPENIVLTSNRQEERECCCVNDECVGEQIVTSLEVTQPKLIDLADCGSIDDKSIYNKLVGTMCYLAPERLRAHYGYELKKADVWAIGVSCYEMLSGKRCFFGANNDQLFDRIKKGIWVWPQGLNLSDNAKNFVATLLEPNCNRRPSAAESLLHPWFSDILNFEANSKKSIEARNEYFRENPLIKYGVERCECNEHYCFQAPIDSNSSMFSMQLPMNNFMSSVANSCQSQSNCNSNSNSNSNGNGNNISMSMNVGMNGQNQISPSASTFSDSNVGSCVHPSCSPQTSQETGACDTPSMQNVSFMMQQQGSNQQSSFYNGQSPCQSQSQLCINRNQIPKFVPATQQQVQYCNNNNNNQQTSYTANNQYNQKQTQFSFQQMQLQQLQQQQQSSHCQSPQASVHSSMNSSHSPIMQTNHYYPQTQKSCFV